jgi:hypothetical protein
MSKGLMQRGLDISTQWDAIAKSCVFCASHQMPCRYPNCGRKLLEDKLASIIWGKDDYHPPNEILKNRQL